MFTGKKNERKDELDGLKGLACFVVFFYHMLLSLFCFSTDHNNLCLNILVKTILNGDFMVYVFACISGWLAYKEQTISLAMTARKSIKRYLRFALLLLFSNLLIFAINKSIGFHSIEAGQVLHNGWLSGFYNSSITLEGTLKQAIYIGGSYNGPIWVLSALILAPCLIYGFSWINALHLRRITKQFIIAIVGVASLISAYFLLHNGGVSFVMLACYSGALAHKYENKVRKAVTMHTIPIIGGGICLYIIAIIAGTRKIHDLLIVIPADILVLITLYIDKVGNILSHKIFLKASKISLAVYILHWPIFCSLGLWLLIKMGFSSYEIHATIVIVVTTVVVVISSWVFHNTIERFVSFFVMKI